MKKVFYNSIIIIATFFFVNVGLVKAVCPDPMPEGMLICDDFEEGASWNYEDNWDNTLGIMDDGWVITATDQVTGSYSGQSLKPHRGGQTLYPGSSTFHASSLSGYDSLFVKFWFKPSENHNCDWAQPFRLFGTSGDLEFWQYDADPNVGDACGSVRVVNSGTDILNGGASGYSEEIVWGNIYTPSEWHEYAMYINYSSNTLAFWKDAEEYTQNDSSYNEVPITYGSWRVDNLILPIYYKANWQDSWGEEIFWIDDIEVWDGLPTSEPADSTAPANPSGLSVI